MVPGGLVWPADLQDQRRGRGRGRGRRRRRRRGWSDSRPGVVAGGVMDCRGGYGGLEATRGGGWRSAGGSVQRSVAGWAGM